MTRLPLAIAVFVGGAMIASTPAEAQTPGNIIYACLSSNGSLRQVLTAAECRRNETVLQWNVAAVGATGATGATGAQGPTGTIGPAGPQGPAGSNGADGAPGAIGPTGPAGPQGAAGSNGADGAAGAIGPTGPAGPQGAAGSDGADGATGAIGPTGPAGSNGVDGATGAQGETGPAGPTGPQGPEGPAGPAGGLPCTACVDSASLAPDVVGRIFSPSGAGNQSFTHTGAGTLSINSTGVGVSVQGVSFQNGNVDVPNGGAVRMNGADVLINGMLALSADHVFGVGEITNFSPSGSQIAGPTSNQNALFRFGRSGDSNWGYGFNVGHEVAAMNGSVALGSFAEAKNGSFVFGDDPRLRTNDGYATQPPPPMLSSDQFGNGFNVFVARATGGVAFVTSVVGTPDGPQYTGVGVPAGGGAWDTLSDVRAKTDWQHADPEFYLRGIARMPIRSWRYRTQDASIRHVGPTAQDFRAAFALGTNDTTISTVDADGASMLAIQALAQRSETLQRQLDESLQRQRDLEARLAALESLLNSRK